MALFIWGDTSIYSICDSPFYTIVFLHFYLAVTPPAATWDRWFWELSQWLRAALWADVCGCVVGARQLCFGCGHNECAVTARPVQAEMWGMCHRFKLSLMAKKAQELIQASVTA